MNIDRTHCFPTLKAFAVRRSESRQVVGIFVAVGLNQLADLVLQCIDPTTTEYLVLGPGEVYAALPTTAQWPAWELRDAEGGFADFEPEDEDPLKAAVLDEHWWTDIDRGDWHRLDWDAVLKDRVVEWGPRAVRPA